MRFYTRSDPIFDCVICKSGISRSHSHYKHAKPGVASPQGVPDLHELIITLTKMMGKTTVLRNEF